MTKISLQNAIAQNDKWVSSRSLTAVFVGGTSGIGEYTLRSLAAHYGKSSQSLSLYLVGRNNDAASRIFNDCRKLCPSGRFTFVKASDLSLIRDVDSASDEIKKLVGDASTEKGTAACIDFLVMSHADLHIGGRRGVSLFRPHNYGIVLTPCRDQGRTRQDDVDAILFAHALRHQSHASAACL